MSASWVAQADQPADPSCHARRHQSTWCCGWYMDLLPEQYLSALWWCISIKSLQFLPWASSWNCLTLIIEHIASLFEKTLLAMNQILVRIWCLSYHCLRGSWSILCTWIAVSYFWGPWHVYMWRLLHLALFSKGPLTMKWLVTLVSRVPLHRGLYMFLTLWVYYVVTWHAYCSCHASSICGCPFLSHPFLLETNSTTCSLHLAVSSELTLSTI